MARIFDFVSAPAPRFLMRLALLERLIEATPKGLHRFLEIGPGLGDVSAYVKCRFPATEGTLVEFSEKGAAILNEKFETDRGISVLCTDFQKHHFASQFGLIMAFEVLEHIEDDVATLEKISRLLEPGGVFLFSAPSFMRKWQQVDEYAGHYRRYERDEIVRKFSAAGLHVETIWSFGFPVTHLLYPLRQAYYAMQRFKNPDQTKEGATKKSGIERPLTPPFFKALIPLLLSPFFLLQNMVKQTDMGDGFLVMARRPT